MNADSLGLIPQDISVLVAILNRHIPRKEVWAFGSRVQGNARPFSDLDLAIIEDEPLSADIKAELRYVLSESNLPVKVDIVEWSRLTPSFQKIIQEKHIILIPKAA